MTVIKCFLVLNTLKHSKIGKKKNRRKKLNVNYFKIEKRIRVICLAVKKSSVDISNHTAKWHVLMLLLYIFNHNAYKPVAFYF